MNDSQTKTHLLFNVTNHKSTHSAKFQRIHYWNCDYATTGISTRASKELWTKKDTKTQICKVTHFEYKICARWWTNIHFAVPISTGKVNTTGSRAFELPNKLARKVIYRAENLYRTRIFSDVKRNWSLPAPKVQPSHYKCHVFNKYPGRRQ